MEYLKRALSLLSNACTDPSVKRKQKILAKITRSVLKNSNIPKSYSELASCLESLCELHVKHPEEPGNILVDLLHLEKYPNLVEFITKEKSVFIDSENLDSFLRLLDNKTRSLEIINKIDSLSKKLLEIKNCDNDVDVVISFESMIQKEYIQMLKQKSEDSNTEIEISGDKDPNEIREIVSMVKVMSENRTRVPSGIHTLDKFLQPGFESTRVYIFGGKPGLGKSTLVLNFFLNGICNIQTKKKKKPEVFVYITLENDIVETFERITRKTTMRPISLRSASDEEVDLIVDTIRGTYSSNLIVKYMTPYTTNTMDIFLYIDRLSEQYTIKAIFVDYLNIISSAEKGSGHMEKRFELGMITSELKVMAKRFQCPVVTPAQLNTSGYDGIPTMKNLDESRQIAQNADFVGLMFEYPLEKIPPQLLYQYPEEEYAIIGVNIDKNRNGPKGLFFLLGYRNLFHFESFDSHIDKNLRNRLLYGDRNQDDVNAYYSPQYVQNSGVQNQNYNWNGGFNDKIVNTGYQ